MHQTTEDRFFVLYRSPLALALINTHPDVAEYLVSVGANVENGGVYLYLLEEYRNDFAKIDQFAAEISSEIIFNPNSLYLAVSIMAILAYQGNIEGMEKSFNLLSKGNAL